MRRFDTSAVKARLLKRMRINENWANLSEDSTVSSILDVTAEGFAENARYMEYLLNEKKWSHATNMSSLTSMGNLICRKKELAKSSIGYVIVSHTDEDGNDRLSNLGRYFFDIDDSSNYDDLTKADASSTQDEKALVPWTADDVYTIPKGTLFTSAAGVSFISTAAVKSRTLKERWSDIQADPGKLTAFYAAGGWSGIKYVKVPVIQGTVKTVNLGASKAEKFETFLLSATNLENASNTISTKYLKFLVTLANGTVEDWVQVRKIDLAGPYDKVFEMLPQADNTVLFKTGNGVCGKLLPEGSTVALQYLETLGDEGNVSSKYQVSSMEFPAGYQMIDPRTGTAKAFLSCTNVTPIFGGFSAEGEEDYRMDAPKSYLKSYAIATSNAYAEQIRKKSPISILKLKVFPADTASFEQASLSSSVSEDTQVLNEISTIKNVLNITAISSTGKAIENATTAFIEPILQSIGDVKGPNDSLAYVAPNFIKVGVNLKVKTENLTVSDSEIETSVKNAVLLKYGIYNTDFKTPLRSSVIISRAKAFDFATSVDLLLESIATTRYSGITLQSTSNGVNVVAIPFSFDKVYAVDQNKRGFKNYKHSSPYLLKVQISWQNDATKTDKNRTLFLYDERNTMASPGTLEEAKIDSSLSVYTSDIIVNSADLGQSVLFYDESKENFGARYVRTAQFPYISDVTFDTFMVKAKSFSNSPVEIRPYAVDSNGKNQVFLTDNVSTELQVTTTGDGTVCYKKDSRYIDQVDIIFKENYDDYMSSDYATGFLLLPLSYFGFDAALSVATTAENKLKLLRQLVENFVDIKVYARPLVTDIEPENWIDFVSVDEEEITVERANIVNS